ncbi:DNA translocase FtsK [Bacillota bacterium Meth-B3]
MAKTAPGSNKKKTTARGAQETKREPAPDRGIWREASGVILFFAGAVLMYFLVSVPETGLGRWLVSAAWGLAGALRYALPLVLLWVGALVAFSGRERGVKKGRVLLIALLILFAMSLVHLFSVEEVMEGAPFHDFAACLTRSYAYKNGGAGVLGALLAWPLYSALGVAGGAMVLVALILADLVLLQKISFRRIGERAQARYDDFREQQLRRATERMAAREAEAVIPKVAPREDEMDDPFAKYLGDSARVRRPGMRVERIDSAGPLPGEPELPAQGQDDASVYDIPNFLAGRRKKVKAGKISVAEPRPLRETLERTAYAAQAGPLAPEPDGSEVAERPRVERGQADVVIDETDWQTVALFDGGADDAALDRFMSDAQGSADGAPRPDAKEPREPEAPFTGVIEDAPPFDMPDVPVAAEVKPAPAPKPKKPARPPIARPAPADEIEYIYPPIDMLEPSKPTQLQGRHERDAEKGKKLVDTLASFGISARMLGVAHGPTVTRFELSPAAGVKVSRITALADDIALNLAAVSVRIEAPIPGKAAVGVEVPNDSVEAVPLRDVLESPECRRHPSRLAVALGRDNAGRYIIADLARMPHVLIAGQTGSGKSVCINSIICSILYRATPDEVRLIMIDPKVVELSSYNGIPHLLVPVVTDPKKAASALEWAVVEMGNRYKQFAERGVRDIKGFNQRRGADESAMPQIVIIIDELADLMMVTPGEVEDAICRLAQLARAAGIHLVIATQRPSVNVITGVIKANIPSRIAFTVASQVDSRTILDVGGAEKLLGRGDMLYAPSGMAKTRVQGAWVSDDEVHAVVEFLKQCHQADYNEDVIEHMDTAAMSDADKEDALNAFDELLPQAVELVVDAGAASVSMLQRRLRVGHSRAGRLIDEMEVRGIVGPDEGSKSRKVLISREQYRNMF